jgi:hypothetical protein
MPAAGWQQLRYWSPHTDRDMVRYSGFDGKGGEFWIEREWQAASGSAKRRQREQALEAINEAIDAGLEPGRVITDES